MLSAEMVDGVAEQLIPLARRTKDVLQSPEGDGKYRAPKHNRNKISAQEYTQFLFGISGRHSPETPLLTIAKPLILLAYPIRIQDRRQSSTAVRGTLPCVVLGA